MTEMSDQAFYTQLQQNLNTLREQGLYKPERVLASRQGADLAIHRISSTPERESNW
jgi:glycine C-acetyltransferase